MFSPCIQNSNIQLSRCLTYLLSKDALMASLSYFFPLPPDFRRPLLISSTVFLLVQKRSNSDHSLTRHYPKSGNRFLDFPAGEDSLGSSEMKQTLSVILQGPQCCSSWNTLPHRPLPSLPLPLDSLFFALRINPELECGDMASFGDASGLPLLSAISPSEADGLMESSALPWNPSLVSPGSSFCPFAGRQTDTGRDRLSWMDLLLGDSCSSSSSASWRNKTNNLQGQY